MRAMPLENFVHDESGLARGVAASGHLHEGAFVSARPEGLRLAHGITPHHAIGGADDVATGPVILLQLHQTNGGSQGSARPISEATEGRLERLEVVDACALEPVDGLVGANEAGGGDEREGAMTTGNM